MYSRNDKLVMKLIGKFDIQVALQKIIQPSNTVHLIFALDTVQTFLTMDDLFFWFVYNFGDSEKIFQFHWAFDIPSLDAVIGFLVQIVYCWRIWILSGWKVIPAVSALVSLSRLSSTPFAPVSGGRSAWSPPKSVFRYYEERLAQDQYSSYFT